ncbi:hypothetical protein BMS3Bbin02_01696 [bacterium BMS3Bbin02]|nr:hypothetical protein BMS3Bbin02_01696 [bacterium BMS3Bbin02]
MFAYRNHTRTSHRSRVHLTDEAGDCRHVAILKTYPGDGVAFRGEIEDRVTILHGRTQRLLNKDVEVRIEEIY